MLRDSSLLHAAQRLRSVAWACATAAVFACWGVAYSVSALCAGAVSKSSLLLHVVVMLATALIVWDIAVRLYQCGSFSGQCLVHRWAKYIVLRRFRLLPTHFVDDGHLVINQETIKRFAHREAVFQHDVLQMYKQLCGRSALLTKADAVNLRLFATLCQRQLKMGWLAA